MTIKLKNISGRNFNGIENNATVNVDEKNKNTYLVAGFVELKDEAQNKITDEVEKTKADLVKEAEELGLEFPKNIGKVKLQSLITEAQNEITDEVEK